MAIIEVMRAEMTHTFKMIKTSVLRMDKDFWKEDERDWVYAYILFHILEAIEFYNSNSAKEWKPMNDVSAKSRKKETETLLLKDKSFFDEYSNQVEKKTMDILGNLSDEDLLENDGFSERGFKSIMHKYSYVMRHSMYHLGELTKSLRARDLERISWA